VYVIDLNSCEIKSDTIVLEEMVGTNDLSAHYRWYPNPVRDNIIVESDIPLGVEIMDLFGKVLIRQPVQSAHDLTVTGLASGIYFLQLSNGMERQVQKWVKL
jgi:hypothetical protein